MTTETTPCTPVRAGHRLALLVTAVLAAGPAPAGEAINRRLAVEAAAQVEVANVSGSVKVSGWNRNEVEVTGELGEGSERLEFATVDKVTRVKVVLPRNARNVDGSELVIRMPAAGRLQVNTVSADIEVTGVGGAQRLVTISGDLRTESGREDVDCKTVSGDVAVNGRGERGLLNLNTVSGDVRVTNAAGELNANTVSGDLAFELGVLDRSRLRSTSGDVTVGGQLGGEARIDAESLSGDVRLHLRGPVAAEFDVATFSGEIRNCFGPKPKRDDEYAPGHSLRFREGPGGGRVRIKTMNGDIDLCRK